MFLLQSYSHEAPHPTIDPNRLVLATRLQFEEVDGSALLLAYVIKSVARNTEV